MHAKSCRPESSTRIASLLGLTAVLLAGARFTPASFAETKSSTKPKSARTTTGPATESATFLELKKDDKGKRTMLRLRKTSDGKEIEIPLNSLALKITGQGERELLRPGTIVSTNVTFHPPKAMDPQELNRFALNLQTSMRSFKPIVIWNNFANGRADATLTSDKITVYQSSDPDSLHTISDELGPNQFPVYGRISEVGNDGKIFVTTEQANEEGEMVPVTAAMTFDRKTKFVNVVSSDPSLLEEGSAVVLEGKQTKTHGFKPTALRATLAEPLSIDAYRERGATTLSKLSKSAPKTPVREKKRRSPDEDS